MKNLSDIEKRFEEINSRPAEVLTPEEEASLAAAEAMNDGETVSLEEFKDEMRYSGKIALRIPRTLHKELKENASREGVSLNQYLIYKLAH